MQSILLDHDQWNLNQKKFDFYYKMILTDAKFREKIN